jgi:hypothetical protein
MMCDGITFSLLLFRRKCFLVNMLMSFLLFLLYNFNSLVGSSPYDVLMKVKKFDLCAILLSLSVETVKFDCGLSKHTSFNINNFIYLFLYVSPSFPKHPQDLYKNMI